MLIYPLVQIDLPPYTDYASLEQKLTLAVECVSVLSRCFTFIYHIASAGRQLALVKNRGYLPYLNGLRSFQIPYLCRTRTLVFPLMSPAPASSACPVSH